MNLDLDFSRRGVSLYYNPAALGYHWHYTTLDSACQRMFYVGKAAQILREIAPQLTTLQNWMEKICLSIPPHEILHKKSASASGEIY